MYIVIISLCKNTFSVEVLYYSYITSVLLVKRRLTFKKIPRIWLYFVKFADLNIESECYSIPGCNPV